MKQRDNDSIWMVVPLFFYRNMEMRINILREFLGSKNNKLIKGIFS